MNIFSVGECMAELSYLKDNKYNLSFAGDTANTAIYLSRLGAKTSYITAVGKDNLSNKMLKYLKNEKVLIKNILSYDKKTIGLYLIENNKKGEREFFYWRSESAAKILFNNIDILKFSKKLNNCDAFYFSGITLSIYDNKNLNKFFLLLNLLKKNNIKIYADLNFRLKNWINIKIANKIIKKFSILCDIIFVSSEDLSLLKIKSFKTFVSEYSKNALVVYREGNGLIKIYQNKKFLNYNIKFEKKVVDTTGCGDAFNASFIINYFKRNNIDLCIKAAHKLGKKVAFTKGAIIKKEKFQKKKLYNLIFYRMLSQINFYYMKDFYKI